MQFSAMLVEEYIQLTNKAQLKLLLFIFIKRPGSGSGRRNIQSPTIGNTCSLCGNFSTLKIVNQ